MKKLCIYFGALTVSLLPFVAFGEEMQEFVPLTSIPAFNEITAGEGLAGFLNGLYRLCIGAAAVLAVIELVRAGILFMTNTGSYSSNEQAKTLVRYSLFGLLLVLSPAIVFGIIDPRILNLDINTSRLQTSNLAQENVAHCAQVGELRQNSQVQPEFRQCCALYGLEARQAGQSNSYVCMAPTSAENNSILLQVGRYYTLVAQSSPSEGASCSRAEVGGYDTQEACQAALPAQEAREGWTVLTPCWRATTNHFPIPLNDSVCEDIGTIN